MTDIITLTLAARIARTALEAEERRRGAQSIRKFISADPQREYKAIGRYKRQKNWTRWVLSHPYAHHILDGRLEAFAAIHELLTDDVYWPLLRRVERTCWQHTKRPLLAALMRVRGGSDNFMTPSERAFYDAQPDLLLAFRGHRSVNRFGKGITYYALDYSYAESWAKVRGSEFVVDSQALPKRDCFIICGEAGRRAMEVLHVRGLGEARRIHNLSKVKHDS